nr:probable steroid-binding protein 3 [Ipomoea batatas]
MEFSTQQLKGYDGTNPSKPIYMAIRAASSMSPPVGTSMVLVGAYPSSLAKISKNAEDVSPSLKAKYHYNCLFIIVFLDASLLAFWIETHFAYEMEKILLQAKIEASKKHEKNLEEEVAKFKEIAQAALDKQAADNASRASKYAKQCISINYLK